MKTAHEYLTGFDIHPSQQRLAIINYLRKHHTHPSAEEIYLALNPEMPTLSRTTIYNTLKLLAEKGAIEAITIDEKTVHYDALTGIHAHFLCQRCGTIYDIPISEEEDAKESILNNESLKDFIVNNTNIYHKGICPQCKTSEE